MDMYSATKELNDLENKIDDLSQQGVVALEEGDHEMHNLITEELYVLSGRYFELYTQLGGEL